MNVPSLEFLGFALFAALVFNLSSAVWWRQAVLLATNLAFHSTFSHWPRAYLPIAAFLAVGYCGVILIEVGSRRITSLFIVALLFCFIWLKRSAFLPNAVHLPPAYVTVGVSYVFFRLMSLLIDRRDGTLTKRLSPITYLNYALNFTSLVSGPIQRFEDYHRMEVEERLPLGAIVVGTAVERIVVGFFKVFLLSAAFLAFQQNRIAALDVDQDWSSRVADGIAIALVYPLYLYLNFSGYTDFVIGVGRFFRIELPENFNEPFSATNFIDFWTRWHITLSSWLKTYVYAPFLLAMMRKFTSPRLEPLLGVMAFFVTFFLIGVWHGQTSEFLFYGFLLGGGMAANKIYQIGCENTLGRKRYRQLCANALYRSLARGLTFSWFAFSLLWFWTTWSQLGHFASRIGVPGLAVLWLAAITIATLGLMAVHEAWRWAQSINVAGAVLSSRYSRTVGTTAVIVVLIIQSLAQMMQAPQVVYKAF
jgi:D-alanyl-lipoteichoic acid acyltransferase DltB (MBOAT superfamily)